MRPARRFVASLARAVRKPSGSRDDLTPKAREELTYWRNRQRRESTLSNDWYRWYYTEPFGLNDEFYAGARILDVGCGPRGSLEWVHGAVIRVGVDPLAAQYVELGAGRGGMRYVAALGERMPFADAMFDIVSSFNSLDHVDDLRAVVGELIRVLAPRGSLLLLVDINHEPTDSEPLRLGWDVVAEFAPPLELETQHQYEKAEGARALYRSIWQPTPYDHSAGSDRPGVLAAHFRKPNR